jgi:uracil-DNA glycosylase
MRNGCTVAMCGIIFPMTERTANADSSVDILHDEIRACRRCLADGFPISPPPIVGGQVPAPFMVIGQAPSLSDQRAEKLYQGPAGRKLIGWLYDAGFTEEDMGTTVYLTALTLCFPGRLPGKSTDRAPSARERANCRPWLDAQISLVKPRVVILFGKMAIDTFLPRLTMEDAIGQVFVRDGITYVPLPHSSGASLWLNDGAHQELRGKAIERIRRLRVEVIGDP